MKSLLLLLLATSPAAATAAAPRHTQRSGRTATLLLLHAACPPQQQSHKHSRLDHAQQYRQYTNHVTHVARQTIAAGACLLSRQQHRHDPNSSSSSSHGRPFTTTTASQEPTTTTSGSELQRRPRYQQRYTSLPRKRRTPRLHAAADAHAQDDGRRRLRLGGDKKKQGGPATRPVRQRQQQQQQRQQQQLRNTRFSDTHTIDQILAFAHAERVEGDHARLPSLSAGHDDQVGLEKTPGAKKRRLKTMSETAVQHQYSSLLAETFESLCASLDVTKRALARQGYAESSIVATWSHENNPLERNKADVPAHHLAASPAVMHDAGAWIMVQDVRTKLRRLHQAFDLMVERSHVTATHCTYILSALSRAGDMTAVHRLFDRMRDDPLLPSPTTEAYNAVLLGYRAAGHNQSQRLIQRGESPLRMSRQLFFDMLVRKPGRPSALPDSMTYEILFDMHGRAGDVDSVIRFYDSFCKARRPRIVPTVRMCNALIHAFAINGEVERACGALEHLCLGSGEKDDLADAGIPLVAPSPFMFEHILKAAARIGSWERVDWAIDSLFRDRKALESRMVRRDSAKRVRCVVSALFEGVRMAVYDLHRCGKNRDCDAVDEAMKRYERLMFNKRGSLAQRALHKNVEGSQDLCDAVLSMLAAAGYWQRGMHVLERSCAYVKMGQVHRKGSVGIVDLRPFSAGSVWFGLCQLFTSLCGAFSRDSLDSVLPSGGIIFLVGRGKSRDAVDRRKRLQSALMRCVPRLHFDVSEGSVSIARPQLLFWLFCKSERGKDDEAAKNSSMAFRDADSGSLVLEPPSLNFANLTSSRDMRERHDARRSVSERNQGRSEDRHLKSSSELMLVKEMGSMHQQVAGDHAGVSYLEWVDSRPRDRARPLRRQRLHELRREPRERRVQKHLRWLKWEGRKDDSRFAATHGKGVYRFNAPVGKNFRLLSDDYVAKNGKLALISASGRRRGAASCDSDRQLGAARGR